METDRSAPSPPAGLIQLVVATTALNRPDLHSQVLPPWICWLNSLDSSRFMVHWIVHVDRLAFLPFDLRHTTENIRAMAERKIDVQIMQQSGGASSHLKACRALAQRVKQIVEGSELQQDTVVFWLEDDWVLDDSCAPAAGLIVEMAATVRCALNLSGLRKPLPWALAPTMITYSLWEQIHLCAWLGAADYSDPEHAAGLRFIREFKKPTLQYVLKNLRDHQGTDADQVSAEMHGRASMASGGSLSGTVRDVARAVRDRSAPKPVFITTEPGLCRDVGRDYLHVKGIAKKRVFGPKRRRRGGLLEIWSRIASLVRWPLVQRSPSGALGETMYVSLHPADKRLGS